MAAASSGVSVAQSQDLHSLYGVGTDSTVTKAPTLRSGGPFHFGSGARRSTTRPKIFIGQHMAATSGLAAISAKDVNQISSTSDVRGVASGLSLSAFTFTGLVQPGSGFTPGPGPGSGAGATLSGSSIGPGHYLSRSDANSDEALVGVTYPEQEGLKVGFHLALSGTSHEVIGVVTPSNGEAGTDVYLPLARAQAAASVSNEVNTIDVEAVSNSAIGPIESGVQQAFPSPTVTTAADLASQVSG